MPQITCVTVAYNAEKTLRRAVKSLLKQSVTDFEYILVDHGSTDGTRRIIQDFEKKDSRVIGVYDDVNRVGAGQIAHVVRAMERARGDWFVLLDADDEYQPRFFQKMLRYAQFGGFDMVCCGSDFVDQASGMTTGRRAVECTLKLQTPQAFSEYLPFYHQFMRTWWGKLISMDVLRKCDWSWASRDEIIDTRFSFECLSHCERVAVIPDVLHRYFVYQSTSYRIVASQEGQLDLRIRGDQRINEFIRRMLMDRCGQVTPRNEDFLFFVYLNALEDLRKVVFNAEIPVSDKVLGLHQMFVCEPVKRLAAQKNLGSAIELLGNTAQRGQLFAAVVDWVMPLAGSEDIAVTSRIVDILAVLDKARLQELLDRAPLLQCVSAQSASFLSTVVAAVLHDDLSAALEEVFHLAGDDIPDNCAESYLQLAEFVCAAAEHIEGWLFFKKQRVQLLLDKGRLREAEGELAELAELLPEDEEVQRMRS